jgi:hypothetical protein
MHQINSLEHLFKVGGGGGGVCVGGGGGLQCAAQERAWSEGVGAQRVYGGGGTNYLYW